MQLNPLWPEPGPKQSCKDCGWFFVGGRGAPVDRCRRHQDRRVSSTASACPAWEPTLDCQDCGACCREAYTTVEVSKRDPFVRSHPERLERVDGRWNVLRAGSRCSCLVGDGRYQCTVYEDRPRTCRDFTRGSANCLDARRRLGLTR